MILLGFEITVRRYRPPIIKTAQDRLFEACDAMNAAWDELKLSQKTKSIRPWILWEEKRVTITEFSGCAKTIHE